VGNDPEPFEFHAKLTELDDGLDTLHRSVQLLRDAAGPAADDHALMLFETALGEIGANVLTHGRPRGSRQAVDYDLRLAGRELHASFVDPGPPAHDHLKREMPAPDEESGRGLAIARALVDELGYWREGDVNTWRLVKRI